MNLFVNKSQISGEIVIPGSKSHTIRALVFAGLAKGKSIIKNPLSSKDTLAMLGVLKAFGIKVEINNDEWIIYGTGFPFKKKVDKLNLMNSGTSLNMTTGMCAHLDYEIVLDGDDSLRKRPMKPILDSLKRLGLQVKSNDGFPPFAIKGPIVGGKTNIVAKNSQYLSSLLINLPLCSEDSHIVVDELFEVPYIKMTLKWLDTMGIKYVAAPDLKNFKIKGNQVYNAFSAVIASDWSSAAFPIAAALLSSSGDVVISGVDYGDVQGDKGIVDILKKMGADIEIYDDYLVVRKSRLSGIEIDLNEMPDALPILSVIATQAEGVTTILNVEQARIKETDRIAVMATELKKMGADIEELKDGLIIKKSILSAAKLKGYDDHRVVMALSVAALLCDSETVIDTAEAVDVTFPDFVEKFNNIGAKYRLGE